MKTKVTLFGKLFSKKENAQQPLTKWCNRCKRYLPIEEFFKNKHFTSGCQSYCKACLKDWIADNKAKKVTKASNTISEINKTLINKTKNMKMHQIIKERRLDMGMSQTEVADKAGVRYQTVLKVEKGGSVTMNTLTSILKVLNMDLAVINKNEDN